MRYFDLGDIDYTGGDIVPELAAANQQAYGAPRRRFVRLNLLSDPLPESDLILCRDCLFHFSHRDVFRALAQFARNSARFLLTTTFTYQSYPRNANIQTGPLWMLINLEMEPYSLPPPIAVIIEGRHDKYRLADCDIPASDTCLGLWRMEDVRARIERMTGAAT